MSLTDLLSVGERGINASCNVERFPNVYLFFASLHK